MSAEIVHEAPLQETSGAVEVHNTATNDASSTCELLLGKYRAGVTCALSSAATRTYNDLDVANEPYEAVENSAQSGSGGNVRQSFLHEHTGGTVVRTRIPMWRN